MENLFLFVLLKIVGVIGPAVCFAVLAYKIITIIGKFSQDTCGYFTLGIVVTSITYGEQLLLAANFMKMPFYTSGLFFGMIISVAVFAWLMRALLQNNFSSGLYLPLRGLII